MLKVYGFDISSPSNKVRMCANALGLDYEYVRLDLPAGEHRATAHLARHPAGKVPVIDDDGFMLFESDAITKYLCRKAGSDYYPSAPVEQARVDQWCNFASIHLHIHIGKVFFNKVIAPRLGLDVDAAAASEARGFIDQILPVFEGQLAKSAHLAGDRMTVADFCLLAVLDPAEAIELDLAQFSKLQAWREGLRAQSFYQRVHRFFGETMMAAE